MSATTNTNKEFPQLETERLILRKMTSQDTETLFNYWSDDEVTRYMNIESFQTETQVEDMIMLLNNLFEENEAIRWGIVRKEYHLLLGT
ncbi:MAG TPA: GNAT family N-acetyltransferase, partial [Oculatellaceae cyanobacterium]